MCAGYTASATMPTWASRSTRRGEADARTRPARTTPAGLPGVPTGTLNAAPLIEPERDAAIRQVVGRHFDATPIAGQQAHTILAASTAGEEGKRVYGRLAIG